MDHDSGTRLRYIQLCTRQTDWLGSGRQRHHRKANPHELNPRKSALPRFLTASYGFHILLNCAVETRRTLPTEAHTLKSHNPFMIDNDVGGEGADVESAENLVILVAVLRPNHPVLCSELAPCLFVAVRADANQNKRRFFGISFVKVAEIRN